MFSFTFKISSTVEFFFGKAKCERLEVLASMSFDCALQTINKDVVLVCCIFIPINLTRITPSLWFCVRLCEVHLHWSKLLTKHGISPRLDKVNGQVGPIDFLALARGC